MEPDFLAYANLETFIFPRIGDRWEKEAAISPIDLAAILSWKAHRKAKQQIDRLSQKYGSWEKATRSLSEAISQAESDKDRLSILMGNPFAFRLPTATAILTALYPERFSVYDYRVINQTGLNAIHSTNSDRVWAEYGKYIKAVRDATPHLASLRDADLYLWGRDRYSDLVKLIA